MTCSPQRFLANDRNLFRQAIIAASSVLPAENKVVPLDRTPGPQGTAQVQLTGTYTGAEQADYEVKILDADVEVARVSAPTSSGAGSGTLTGITATGAAQIYTLECVVASIAAAAASAQVEGATIAAAATGTDGNYLRITVDQSGLVYTDTDYSLVQDVQAGQGGLASPLVSQAFNFDTALLDGQGLIPASAHRIAFEGDRSNIYLQYRAFVDGETRYYTVPALKRDYPKGTRIQFVTGGRTIAVSTTLPTPATETVSDIVTAFDFLNWIRTVSLLLVVKGVVPNDRTPTGLASREFSLRTDAHADASTGSGSSYAKGFSNISVAADAGTQLVTATCFAVTSADHPNANLGHTLWQLKSSLLGDLGIIAEGVPFGNAVFGLMIPIALPPGFDAPKGSISANYIPTGRVGAETIPPVCFPDMALGPNAIDGTYTFELVARPSGDCDCRGMPVPRVSQFCLGNPTEGGDVSTYEADTVARLITFRDWHKGVVRELTIAASATKSAIEAPALSAPQDAFNPDLVPPGVDTTPGNHYAQATESLRTVVDNFEATIAQIDPLPPSSPPGYREAGMDAWDAAVTELQGDIDGMIGGSPGIKILNIPSGRYDASLTLALITAGIPGVGKADASTVSGDGCWRDTNAPQYWKSIGSDLMPMFTNTLYYASRPNGSGRVFSSHEFSIIVNVKCEGDLKIGDRVQVDIKNASRGSTYQVGDAQELPIIAAAPLTLTGGVDGAPTQTWTLTGSVDGPFAAYSFNPDAPVAYAGAAGSSTIAFLLNAGGIPAAKGDRFRFAVEGGHYTWRKNGGAWDGASPPLPIPLGSDALDAGLSVSFIAGAASSFVADDLFAFRALQPWAPSNTLTPNKRVWKWADSSPDTATYAADLGSTQQLDLFAMLCTLPDGASATLWGGADAGATDWSEALTVRAGCIWQVIDHASRYIRIVFANATGGALQYPWIGVPLLTPLSADVALTHDFSIKTPGGNLQGGRFAGRTISATVSWSEATLPEATAEALIAMLYWVKQHDDEPLLLITQTTRANDPVIVARVGANQIEFVDHAAYNQNAGIPRKVSCTIPFDGVLS
jgi:hypothetical protein